MSKNRHLLYTVVVAIALVVSFGPLHAFAAEYDNDGQMPTTWDDFAGARAAILTGSPFDEFWYEKCPDAGEVSHFNTMPDMIAAAKAGKVDVLVNNEAVCTLAANRNDDLVLFPEWIREFDMGIAFTKGSEWMPRFKAITERLRADGTADKLWEKWTGTSDSDKTVPEQDWPGANGTLKVAACQSLEPVSYYGENGMLGYDIETLLLAAKELDVHLEFTPTELADLLAMAQSGKVDIACGSLLITKERSQAMDFAPTHANNLALVVHVAADAQSDAASDLELKTVDEVVGKRIGVATGTTTDLLLMADYEGISEKDFSYYNSISELVGALKSNKIDAIVIDSPMGALAAQRNTGIGIIPQVMIKDKYGYALPKDSPLTPQFNEVIAQMHDDGTIDKIYKKWTGADEDAKVMPKQDWDAPNGTLICVNNAEAEPASYLSNNEAAGFSSEILVEIAHRLGYHIEFRIVPFASLIAELTSGKADVGASLLSITDERKKTIDMTDPYQTGGLVALVRMSESAQTSSDGFFAGIAASFERTFITENRWKLILSGLGVTVLVTLLSGMLGTLMGFATVLLRRRGNHFANTFVGAFEGLMGRLPIVVVLMVFYYVIFGSVDVSGVAVATVVFTLAFGASAGAIMWNAVQAVDVGQTEASLALGFTDRQTFFGVVLPQAARRFLPLLSGQLVSLAKDTSVIGYIAVQDLTRAGDLIRSRTMEAFFPLLATAAIYFALCCLLAAAMGVVIRHLDLERRPRTIQGVQL